MHCQILRSSILNLLVQSGTNKSLFLSLRSQSSRSSMRRTRCIVHSLSSLPLLIFPRCEISNNGCVIRISAGHDAFSTNVTDDKSHIPDAISVAPKYQDIGTYSPKNTTPYTACFVVDARRRGLSMDTVHMYSIMSELNAELLSRFHPGHHSQSKKN